MGVVDAQLGVGAPNGTFWHRYNFDGYGEQADGSPWDVGFPAGSQATIGRIWPIFAGERGEYEPTPDSRLPVYGELPRLGDTAAARWRDDRRIG